MVKKLVRRKDKLQAIVHDKIKKIDLDCKCNSDLEFELVFHGK